MHFLGKTFLFLTCLFLFQTQAEAQKKVERESSIRSSRVPAHVKKWIDSLEGKRRLHWIIERQDSSYNYEAKFIYQGLYYSVEIDTSGQLRDIEIEKSKKQLDSAVYRGIEEGIAFWFDRFRIRKIQIQYTGSHEHLLKYLYQNDNSSLTKRFEVVFSSKVLRIRENYESLHAEDGRLIEWRLIVSQGFDSLMF